MKHFFHFAVAAVLVLSGAVLEAAPSPGPQHGVMPLESVLNPDGTVNTGLGFRGTLDVRGWRMKQEPGGGPRFERLESPPGLDAADTCWDNRFFANGITTPPTSLMALAVIGTDLYVGGGFLLAGGVRTNYVAKWNGTTWSALGTGMDDWVWCLAVMGTDLVAGGFFTTAGGVSANHVARWNGSSWSALGTGTDAPVRSLAVLGTDLYAGGNFAMAGGTGANRVAKWNGTSWSAVGTGMNDEVWCLAAMGTDLVAGGRFTWAGGVIANRVAKWNGSDWSALGSGMNHQVVALAAVGSDLYAGGDFDTAGGVRAPYVAKWNGTAWSTLGGGVSGWVWSIAPMGTDLYVGGAFTTAGDSTVGFIARWNGTAWSGLEGGMDAPVMCVRPMGTALFALGDFKRAGGAAANGVARWDGSRWSAVGPGMGVNDLVTSIAVSGGDIYVGGSFTGAGSLLVNYVAKWDGSAWSKLGSGMNQAVTDLALIGTDLYAGGMFTTAGGVTANRVARWNGSSWSAVGTGMDGTVRSLAIIGTDLYAGGSFTTAGGVSANRIAKWDGSSWSALGTGMDQTVYALAVIDTNLYAGGFFLDAGGVSANHVAVWNGTSWSPLGAGVGGGVTALAAAGTDLYVGGYFSTAGGTSAANVAKWNGSSWSALGAGTNSSVYALVVSGSDLYAGGDFTAAGGATAWSAAKWNGTSWSALGTGLDDRVQALAAAGSDIYLGGLFTVTGDKSSRCFARWISPGARFEPLELSVEMGSVALGGSRTDSVGVRNLGTSTVTVDSVVSTHPDFDVTPDSGTVGAGSTRYFQITLTPNGPGTRTGQVIFMHNAPGSPDTVEVSGTGVDSAGRRFLSLTPVEIFDENPLALGTSRKPAKRAKAGKPITPENFPTWTNLVSEIVIQGAFAPYTSESDAAGGAVIGQSLMVPAGPDKWKPHRDSAAIRCWVRPDKWDIKKSRGKNYKNFQKTLFHKLNGFHDGTPRGLDFTTDGRNKPLNKERKKLETKKHDNALFGELVALKVNIGASQLRTTPVGFGDLVYENDGNPYDEMSILEISAAADMMMTYWQGNDSADYAVLHAVMHDLNRAFSGPLDTVQFNDYTPAGNPKPLIVAGQVDLATVPYLKLVPPYAVTVVPRLNAEVEPEEDPEDAEYEEAEEEGVPLAARVYQNYPNPFNPVTTIGFRLGEASRVTIRVYNLLGQEVGTLMAGEECEEGYSTVEFTAAGLASGIYFYRVEAAGLEEGGLRTTETRKMMVLK
ncbi:MAG: T9SS type A sorting domain-containing protein [Bacteroidota bacterium]